MFFFPCYVFFCAVIFFLACWWLTKQEWNGSFSECAFSFSFELFGMQKAVV